MSKTCQRRRIRIKTSTNRKGREREEIREREKKITTSSQCVELHLLVLGNPSGTVAISGLSDGFVLGAWLVGWVRCTARGVSAFGSARTDQMFCLIFLPRTTGAYSTPETARDQSDAYLYLMLMAFFNNKQQDAASVCAPCVRSLRPTP
jgi:hypothetical protein